MAFTPAEAPILLAWYSEPETECLSRRLCKRIRAAIAVLVNAAVALSIQGELLEDVEKRLSFAAFEGRLRLKISGTLDLEAYNVDKPAPALVFTRNNFLLNPRLTVYLDAKFDSYLYWFVQTRVDRGFDPSDAGVDVRLTSMRFESHCRSTRRFPGFR